MNKKLFLTSILAMVFIAPTMAQNPTLGPSGGGQAGAGGGEIAPGGPDGPEPPQLYCLESYSYAPGEFIKNCAVTTCTAGHYCPYGGTTNSNMTKFTNYNIESCPDNYDNTATGLKTIEECCLLGYNPSTGLCEVEGVFPSSGYMKENQTYANAATETNMDGVYSGEVNAIAEYDLTNYYLLAGKYLPADSETPTTCLAGSFCSGIGNVNYNQTSAQGIESCPTGYTSSAAGASSANECYRTCSGNITIDHATEISGNDYYGSGVDTCAPTACEHGWHVKAGVNGSAIASTIGNTAGANTAYINNSSSFTESGASHGATYYGLTDNNTWATDYGNKGMLVGQARCSRQEGTGNSSSNPTIKETLTDETGLFGAEFCYCKLTGYKDASGNMQSLSSPWVFSVFGGDYSYCENYCAGYCADGMGTTFSRPNGSLVWRAAVLGTIESSAPTCAANTITINWTDVDAATAGQNDEGTATYGGDVRTPFKAATKPGKRFLGWIFSKPTTTPLPE